jgi:hypothetical protein
MRIRRVASPPTARRATEKIIQNFSGLNTTAPYTQLKDSQSPYFYNVRLYARNASDRRVAVGTRKGPGFYSVPVGEAVDQQQTSVTGTANQTVDTTLWYGKKFTAGTTGRLSKVELNLKTGTSPTQHLIVKIYTDSSGSPGSLVATSSILSSTVTASYAYTVARFIEAPAVTSGTSYWVIAYMQTGGSGSYNWSSTTNATTAKTSNNQGASWSTTTYDLNIKTYVSTDSKFLGGIRYTPSNATAKTIIAVGTSVYSVSDINGSLTVLKSGLSASATEYNFGQSNDTLYITNGQDSPQQYDGTIWQALSASSGYTDPGGLSGASDYLVFHKNRMWLVSTSNPTRVSFSDLGDYNKFTSTNFIYAPAPKSGDPITGLLVFQDNLIVFTRKTKYVLYGDDPGNFVLRQSSGKKGAVSQYSIAASSNHVYFLSDDGVYRYNGSADELMSDPIQNEIDAIADKSKASAVFHSNYYRLYYPNTGALTNNSSVLWDDINNQWLRDSNTFVDKPFIDEVNALIEGSSQNGAVFKAEQQYSDLGKPISFKYWTKYFGDGLHKIFMRRVIPSIRLQTQPYRLNVYIDLDQKNTIPIQYQIAAQASGATWGGGGTWTTGSVISWGSAAVSIPTIMQGSEAYWHQIRFEQDGVDTPVEILSYIIQLRSRRLE